MSAQPAAMEQTAVRAAMQEKPAAPPSQEKAPKASPNKEILTRKPTYNSEADHVMGVIAKSNGNTIESGGKRRSAPDPLNAEVASYGLYAQLRPGDQFSPPMTIELNHVTYTIGEVFTNQDGTVMLRNPNGGAIELSSIMTQTRETIRGLLPDPTDGEPAQTTFIRAFMQSQEKGGQPVDQTILKEAARAVGLLVNEDILDMAVKSGKITQEEADRILHPKPAETPKTESEKPKDGTDAEAKPEEPAKPAEKPLSEAALKLQEALGQSSVLTAGQVEQSFRAMGIPYSSGEFISQMDTKVKRLQALPILIKTAEQGGKGNEAVQLTQEMKQLDDEIKELGQISETLKHYHAGSWNVVETYYDSVEAGDMPAEGVRLPAMVDAIMSGDDQKVLKAVVDRKGIREVDVKDTLQKFKKNVIKYGSFGLAANLAMIYLASKKKNEQ